MFTKFSNPSLFSLKEPKEKSPYYWTPCSRLVDDRKHTIRYILSLCCLNSSICSWHSWSHRCPTIKATLLSYLHLNFFSQFGIPPLLRCYNGAPQVIVGILFFLNQWWYKITTSSFMCSQSNRQVESALATANKETFVKGYWAYRWLLLKRILICRTS